MNKAQRGFALFEGLLIFIIIAVIAGVGWYAIHTKHQTDKILSQADKISQSTPQPTKNSSKNDISTNSQAVLIDYTKDGSSAIIISNSTDISKLKDAPDDFKQFILAELAELTKEAGCPGQVTVNKVYGDNSGVGGEGTCGGGSAVLWVNSSGWKKADSSQNIGFHCSILRNYKIPSSLVDGQCFDGTGVATYNQN